MTLSIIHKSQNNNTSGSGWMMLYWCVCSMLPGLCVIGREGGVDNIFCIWPPILCPSYVIHMINIPKQVFPVSSGSVSTCLVPRLSVGVNGNQWIKSRVCRPMKEPRTHKLIGLQPCLASSTAWPQLEGRARNGWERGRESYKTNSHIESESILSPCPGVVEVSTTVIQV